MRLPATARALPALFKVGFAEAVAYRAEFLVWMLSNTMPLIMLALWSALLLSKLRTKEMIPRPSDAARPMGIMVFSLMPGIDPLRAIERIPR